MNGDLDKLTCGGINHTDEAYSEQTTSYSVMPTMPVPVMAEWQATLVVNNTDNFVTSFHIPYYIKRLVLAVYYCIGDT